MKDVPLPLGLLCAASLWMSAHGLAQSTNPALGVSASLLSFATPVAVTQVSSSLQALTVANNGSSTLPLTITVSGDFSLVNGCASSLASGQTCVVQVGFAPSQPNERDGVLSVAAGASYRPTTVSLSGTGLAILPDDSGTLSVWQTMLGEPVVVWYKVQQPIAYLTATTSSSLFGVAFVQETGSGHGSLPAESFKQSATANCNNCWLGVQFFSQTAGTVDASLALASDAGGSAYTVALVGTALPVVGLLLSPTIQDFGAVPVNSSSAGLTFGLTNMQGNGEPVTVQSVAVTGDFAVLANTTGGAGCSGTLGSTATCFVQLSFAPTAVGARAGTLTIVTSGGTVTAALTGTGSADPGLAINPIALNFTNVPGTTATQQTVTLLNTGSVSLEIGAVSSSDPGFGVSSSCGTLSPRASCSVVVGFTPRNQTVATSLSIPVTTTADGLQTTVTYTVALTGTYTTQSAGLEIVAGDANFAAANTGALGVTREFTLNNLTAKALKVSFTMPREFPLASAEPCATLTAGGSCIFSVSFLPVTGGPLTGSIVAQGAPEDGSANVQALAYMLGYGAAFGSLSITGNTIPNTPLSFGQVSSGQSVQQVLTLTNSGSGPLTIHRLTIAPPFYSTSTCGGVLAPNGSCKVTLTYAPVDEVSSSDDATLRTDTGTLVIESDAVSSPDQLEMTGTAIPVVSSNPANPAVLNAFGLSESSVTFANTQVGDVSAAQTIVLTNTGTTTLHIVSATASTDFTATTTCSTLLPAETCSSTIQFVPTTASSSSVRSGAMEIASDAGTSLEFVSLLGTSVPAPLTLSPTALDFGTVSVGASDALSVTVTNVEAEPVTFLGLATSGGYSVMPGSCPRPGSTLAAGASCVLTVTFTPTAAGTLTSMLSLSTDATQVPLTVSLTGVATEAQLTATPGALAFGSIDVSFPATLTLTLLNNGTASVTGIGNAVSGANAGDFAVTVPCSVTTLAPNQGCTETVTFIPSAGGLRTANLSVASSDPNGPAVIALSGTGVQAGSFTLTVNGASAAMETVASGSPGTYTLLLTPSHGFTGAVALTCTPVTAGEYANCSLLASTLTVGSTAVSSTATINTITSEAGSTSVEVAGLLFASVTLMGILRRKKMFMPLCLATIFAVGVVGCGGGGGGAGSTVRTTPAGTYQYKVTASTTSGAAVTSSVMLTLVVQ